MKMNPSGLFISPVPVVHTTIKCNGKERASLSYCFRAERNCTETTEQSRPCRSHADRDLALMGDSNAIDPSYSFVSSTCCLSSSTEDVPQYLTAAKTERAVEKRSFLRKETHTSRAASSDWFAALSNAVIAATRERRELGKPFSVSSFDDLLPSPLPSAVEKLPSSDTLDKSGVELLPSYEKDTRKDVHSHSNAFLSFSSSLSACPKESFHSVRDTWSITGRRAETQKESHAKSVVDQLCVFNTENEAKEKKIKVNHESTQQLHKKPKLSSFRLSPNSFGTPASLFAVEIHHTSLEGGGKSNERMKVKRRSTTPLRDPTLRSPSRLKGVEGGSSKLTNRRALRKSPDKGMRRPCTEDVPMNRTSPIKSLHYNSTMKMLFPQTSVKLEGIANEGLPTNVYQIGTPHRASPLSKKPRCTRSLSSTSTSFLSCDPLMDGNKRASSGDCRHPCAMAAVEGGECSLSKTGGNDRGDCLLGSAAEAPPPKLFCPLPEGRRGHSARRLSRSNSRGSLRSTSLVQATPARPVSRPPLHLCVQAVEQAKPHASFLLATPTKTFSCFFSPVTADLSLLSGRGKGKEKRRRTTPLQLPTLSSADSLPPVVGTTKVVIPPSRSLGSPTISHVLSSAAISSQLRSTRGKPVVLQAPPKTSMSESAKTRIRFQHLMREETALRDVKQAGVSKSDREVRWTPPNTTSGGASTHPYPFPRQPLTQSAPKDRTLSKRKEKVRPERVALRAGTLCTNSTALHQAGTTGISALVITEGSNRPFGNAPLPFYRIQKSVEFTQDDEPEVRGALAGSNNREGVRRALKGAAQSGKNKEGLCHTSTTTTSGDDKVEQGLRESHSDTRTVERSPSPRGHSPEKTWEAGEYTPISRTKTAHPHSVARPGGVYVLPFFRNGERHSRELPGFLPESWSRPDKQGERSGLRGRSRSSSRVSIGEEGRDSSPRIYSTDGDTEADAEDRQGTIGPREWSIDTTATIPFTNELSR